MFLESNLSGIIARSLEAFRNAKIVIETSLDRSPVGKSYHGLQAIAIFGPNLVSKLFVGLEFAPNLTQVPPQSDLKKDKLKGRMLTLTCDSYHNHFMETYTSTVNVKLDLKATTFSRPMTRPGQIWMLVHLHVFSPCLEAIH